MRVMGCGARGVKSMKLAPEDRLIGLEVLPDAANMVSSGARSCRFSRGVAGKRAAPRHPVVSAT